MSDLADSKELKGILARINNGLKELIPRVKDPEIRNAVERLEKLSRYKYRKFLNNSEATEFAMARARERAKGEGEVFVVAQSTEKLVLVEKQRFYKEHPFGLQEKDIIYDTGLAQKGTE